MKPQENGEAGRKWFKRLPVIVLWLVAVAIIIVDQATKQWALSALADGRHTALIGRALGLVLVRNPGAAFSFATGQTWVFALIASLVVAIIIRVSRNLASRSWAVALGLVLGGAVGNLIDRLLREPGFLRGHVIDFKPGRRTATGLPGTNGEVTYTFGEEFQTPTTVICLPDGNAYRVLKTDDGLYIYKSKLNDGNWEDAEEALVSQARRIKYYSPDGSSEGFYPVTAHQPLTRGILGQLTVAELPLMRNEIYARRGLRFNSPDLRERFEGQAWYKPDTDDISTRLTELDAINIELIRQAEIMEE